MGRMKDLHITVYAGGDEAVAAVERIGTDWREQLEQAASEIERLRAEQRWIPVSERLPDIGVSVLCSSKEPPEEDLVWIGQREQYEWYFPGANEMGEPTHWMPLPEPPAE
jgi:hypothetical protein